MVEFPNELATQVIVVDNNGTPVVLIGPGAFLEVDGVPSGWQVKPIGLNSDIAQQFIDRSGNNAAPSLIGSVRDLDEMNLTLSVGPGTDAPGTSNSSLTLGRLVSTWGFSVSDARPGTIVTLTADGMFIRDDQLGVGSFIDGTTGFIAHWTSGGGVETWHNLSFSNGWSGTGQYKINPDGTVWMRGTITPGTRTGGTVIATLPVGYRPTMNDEYVISWAGGAFWNKITPQTNGQILYFDGTGGGTVGTLSAVQFSTV